MRGPNGIVAGALRCLTGHLDDFKKTLVDLTRTPSVSASGFPTAQVRRSAEAAAEALRKARLENVRVLDAPAENESLHLGDREKGMRAAVHLYDELSRVPVTRRGTGPDGRRRGVGLRP